MNNLYKNILEFSNIIEAYNEVCRNTRNERRVVKLKEYKSSYIHDVYKALVNKNYVVGPSNVFYIYEPKKRRIVSQNIHDKIVNHLVARFILYPALMPSLIEANVASRPNLGTDKGYELYQKFRTDCCIKYKEFFILKCDISKFFASIDHDILKQKLLKKIKDSDALDIIFRIIDSEPAGLNIGSMTSQTLAIFYLNDLDHFIKEKLKIKYYIRYQDDFLLLHPSKEYLKYCLQEITKFVEKEKLKLNDKTRIYKSTDNFIFLGRNTKNIPVKYRQIKRKLKKMYYLYSSGSIDLQSITSSITCYSSMYPKLISETLYETTFKQVKKKKELKQQKEEAT